MTDTHYRKLKRTIFVTTTTLILAIVSATAWNFIAEHRNTLETAKQTSAGYARALAQHAESSLAESDLVLKDIIHEINLSGTPPTAWDQQKLFQLIVRHSAGAPQIGMVFLVDSNGQLFLNSNNYPPKKVDVADREYFRHFVQHPETEFYLSDPLFSRLTAQWRFNLMRPLRDRANRIDSIIAVAFNTTYFKNLFPAESMGKNGRLLLVKENGAPIVNEPGGKADYELNLKHAPLFTEHLSQRPSSSYSIPNGIIHPGPRIVSYQKLHRFPIVAIVTFDQEEVLAAWYKRSLLISLLIVAFSVATVILVRTLFEHLDRLGMSRETILSQQLQLQARVQILEGIAAGADLGSILEQIVRMVEQENPGALCSLLLLDEKGEKLRHGAAPSLPDVYNRAVDGLPIGPKMGSCGTAAYTRKRVIVEKIEGHPFWKGFTPAREAGLKSCWSEPIISAGNELLGTFAIYHREEKSPTDGELSLIETAAHLAAIAIGNVRQEEMRQTLEERLLHMQKIDAVGQLAGGIAHDFNNLLTPIIAYADMLQHSLEHDERSRLKASNILTAGNKAKELTRQLLTFGRKQNLIVEPHDLNEIVTSFKEIMRRTIREEITINLQLSKPDALVLVDRGQMEQILLNLAVNAQDAITGVGEIRIETGHVFLDNEYVRQYPDMVAGRYILLTFIDTGSGMPPHVISHIFEPFFTTKPVGQGTGLGLATVYGIVKQHNGSITLTSIEGAGTSFQIYLPEHVLPKKNSQESTPSLPVKRREPEEAGRTVLLVEDNEAVRELMAEILKTSGYTPIVAETPSQAVDMLSRNSGTIDLLITDIIMPEMNGIELYEIISKKYPALPVLFVSGYATTVFEKYAATVVTESNFLPKPFSAENFLYRVTTLINNS